MRVRNQEQRRRRVEQQQHHEDLAEHRRALAREMNALRVGYRGRPVPEITAMLSARYASDLDTGRLDSCAEAIAANREVHL